MRTNSKLVLSVGLAAATLALVLANTVSGVVLRTGLVPVLGLGVLRQQQQHLFCHGSKGHIW
jgi:hypothetical protein